MLIVYESGGFDLPNLSLTILTKGFVLRVWEGFAFPTTDSEQPSIFMHVLFSTSLAALPETSPE